MSLRRSLGLQRFPRPTRVLGAALLWAWLSCLGVGAQPLPLPDADQEADVQEVYEALQDPVLAPPGDTLRDVPWPSGRLSLEDALRKALSQHPELQAALATIEAREFGVTASTAARYPRFSFTASAGQTGSTGQPGGQEVIRTGIQRAYGLGISLSQQLLDFGRTHHRVQIAELDLASTRLAYLQARQAVLHRVVQAYFNLLREAQGIEVAIANVRNAELLVEQARGFLEAGTRAKIELIRAEADLANAKFLLVRAEGGYGRALAALATALGEDQLPQAMPEPFELADPGWDVDQVRSLARRERPDVIVASLRVAQADARIQAARSEYYPSIALTAGYNWNDSIFPPLNTAYNVGIRLNVPLINEPELSAAVGTAVAEHKTAVSSLKSAELTAVEEATTALYTFREAVGSAQSSGEALRAAEENFRLASERYRVGVGNSLEVSEAQRLLVEARSVELQARYNVQTAIGSLLLATGQIDGEVLLQEDLRLDPIFDLPEQVLPNPPEPEKS